MYLLADVAPASGSPLVPILIIAGVAVVILALVVMRRRKNASQQSSAAPLSASDTTPAADLRAAIPASKEVFAPLPEPKVAEPKVAEPKVAEPKAAEPKVAEPKVAEPKVAEPKVAEQAPSSLPVLAPDEAAPSNEAHDVQPAEALVAQADKQASDAKKEAEQQASDAAEKLAEQQASDAAEKLAEQQASDAKKKAEQQASDAKKKAEQQASDAAEKLAEAKKLAEAEPKSLKDGLVRTRKEGFIARLGGLFKGKAIDEDLVDEIEEILFTADIGVRTADRLLEKVREALSRKELKDTNKVWDVLRDEATTILAGATANDQTSMPSDGQPRVLMVLGVNGVGKTTSIGKMAHRYVAEGKKVALIAGDTFRAAAAEQLEHWGRRVGAEIYRGAEGADPASVVFDGVRKAVDAKAEIVLVDTAGRLHTQKNLMEELRKVRRVMGKAIDGAPHEVIMVLDATTGQNAISQATQFKEATEVTSIILTKLDGTAKGGVVLGVCNTLNIPIKHIGIGERVADLRDFNASEFVDALFAPPN